MKIDFETTQKYDLEEIVNSINDKKIREFLYKNLRNDLDLLNKFRVEFSDYFPKLTKENYKNKIYNAINSCYDRYGYIDYTSTSDYSYAMYEYINEAEKLLNNNDYDTAFTIVTIILDSIPNTDIDDSDGSTSIIADSCIEIIYNILEKASSKNNNILKTILDYAILEVKTVNLYNYGINLKEILKYFIDKNLYITDIEISLEKALNDSKDKSYFFSRKDYIDYLIKIYKLTNKNDKIIKLLEEYSFDKNICLKYIDELIKQNKIDIAIKVLKDKIDIKNHDSRTYADKLSQIFIDNNMKNEYKNILYDIFLKYDKYDFNIYLKIKKLYSNSEWDIEKEKIINIIKTDYLSDRTLNKIYIEENMIDELFTKICNYRMDYIEEYEKYLIPKYNKEILNIYMKSCLNDAECAKNRKAYREVAIKINHIIKMENSLEIVKLIIKEINEKYFRSRSAMVDEFNDVIKNLDTYLD